MGLGFLTRKIPIDDSPASYVLKEMGEAVDRADGVVSDLLEFASPKELELEETDIEPLIRQSLRFVKHEINAAKVTVVTNFAGRLPKCRVDPNKLKQVLVNLFVNACHAMPEGGTLGVATRYHQLVVDEDATGGSRPGFQFRAGDTVFIVEISDTGVGIPPDQLSRVFDPYFTTKSTGKGNGLGLTVTKTIIDLHGGRIQIANRDGGGVMATLALRNRRQDEKH
jgi:signal transduction histidine kinase